MAATAVTFALGDITESQNQPHEYIQQMNFISKTLNECAKVSGFATHVCSKLQRNKTRTQLADLEEHSSPSEDVQGAGQVFPAPLDPLYEDQAEMEGSIHAPLDCDGSNFPECADIEGQLDDMLFANDQEGETMSPFDWSEIMA
ncbi:hypothetical protein NW762_011108 [Fusarium torreyae]|uniref:Uncharacterized protein n=1 Tax=Fusarium torreyae TaxID=1237075 RepID=A0A9W8RS53_9HYPO|nr:hypothetical protein NW762_011108 [Fusarium torreyae]